MDVYGSVKQRIDRVLVVQGEFDPPLIARMHSSATDRSPEDLLDFRTNAIHEIFIRKQKLPYKIHHMEINQHNSLLTSILKFVHSLNF